MIIYFGDTDLQLFCSSVPEFVRLNHNVRRICNKETSLYLWFFWQTQTLAAFSSAILCFKFLALFENCLNLENVLSNCLAVSTLVHFWLSVYIRDIYLRKNLSCLENTVQNEMNPTEQYVTFYNVTNRVYIYIYHPFDLILTFETFPCLLSHVDLNLLYL